MVCSWAGRWFPFPFSVQSTNHLHSGHLPGHPVTHCAGCPCPAHSHCRRPSSPRAYAACLDLSGFCHVDPRSGCHLGSLRPTAGLSFYPQFILVSQPGALGQRPTSPSSLALPWPCVCWPDPTAQVFATSRPLLKQDSLPECCSFPRPGFCQSDAHPALSVSPTSEPHREAHARPLCRATPSSPSLWAPRGLETDAQETLAK